jgi:beta-phosphoglucomutase
MKAVIFDLDGVICFTDQYHYQAWKALADEEHIYFDETINNRLRGVSRMDSLEIILEKADRTYSPEEKAQMAETKNELYVKLLEQMSPADLSDEVKETLDELRGRGYRLAIGSSSKNTKRILKQIGLGDYFDAISDGTNITHSKPDPEVFLKAAEMLGEQPADCLVVEDALAGIEAAYRGGFKSAGIGEAAIHAHVNYPIQTFSDLKNICGSTDISYRTEYTESGIQVLLTGGDRPHIGAVSVIGPDTELCSITFPGHKETVISEKWARTIYGQIKPEQPVVVSVGIHYDGITKQEIDRVLEKTDELLARLLEEVKLRMKQ